jgi:LmbE family N-acetylglucosaminyl deacetylase
MSDPASAARAVPVNDLPTRGAVSTNLAVPAVALAIGAHPDDIEFGCGGTLAKWAAAGTAIHHLVLTDGAKGSWDPQQNEAALIALRQEEQRHAAKVLGGGDVSFLGRTDGELCNGVAEQWEVSRWIRQLRPDVVLGHDPWRRYRLHPDHRAAGFLVTDGIVAARDPHFFPEQGPAHHRPDKLLLWEADEADHVEDAGGHAGSKLAALLAHKSQFRSTMHIDDPESDDETAAFRQRVLGRLADHGGTAGFEQGEAFKLIASL